MGYYTYGSYAGLIVIGGGFWYLTNRKKNAKKPVKKVDVLDEKRPVAPRKDSKKAKKQRSGATSGSDAGEKSETTQKGKKTKAVQSKPVAAPVTEAVLVDDGPDDEIDNREFARQLSNAKAGTNLTSRPQASSRQKSIKQSRALESNSTGYTGAQDSADGDDDLSSANSPPFGATSSHDVSDMLEPQTSGPSVLRLTEPTNPRPQKPKMASRPSESAETKKQRQNKKKAEAKKAQREEDEKERRVLLEKQLRTARIAEGRAAKDGQNFMATSAPSSSAWTGSAADGANHENVKPAPVELLDTYEPSTAGATTNGSSKVTWQKDLPSEEEQLRRLNEDDDSAWATVSKKKTKKAAPVPEEEKRRPSAHPSAVAAAIAAASSKSSSVPTTQHSYSDWDNDDLHADHGPAPPSRTGPTGATEHPVWVKGKGWEYHADDDWAAA